MKFKYLILGILLLTLSFSISDCGAKENNDEVSILKSLEDSISSYESRIDEIITKQGELKSQVDRLSDEMENFEGAGHNKTTSDWIVVMTQMLVIIISLVLAISSFVYAKRIYVKDKSFIEDANDRVDELEKALKSLKPGSGVSNVDFQELKGQVSYILNGFEGLKETKQVAKIQEEIETSSYNIKTGYFEYPISGEAGNVYFNKFVSTNEGVVFFNVDVDGDNATFEPISIKEIRFDTIALAIEFSGNVSKANAQEMDVQEKGTAVRQNDGRWLMTKKTKIILK